MIMIYWIMNFILLNLPNVDITHLQTSFFDDARGSVRRAKKKLIFRILANVDEIPKISLGPKTQLLSLFFRHQQTR